MIVVINLKIFIYASNKNKIYHIFKDYLKLNKVKVITNMKQVKDADFLLVVNATYNKEIYSLVQDFLDIGREIFVIPNGIDKKEAYFSNLLIKEGAIVITSRYELLKYLHVMYKNLIIEKKI